MNSETLRYFNNIIALHNEKPSDDAICHTINMTAVEYFQKLVRVANAAKLAQEMLLNIEYNHIERSIEAVAILYDPLLKLEGHHEETGRR